MMHSRYYSLLSLLALTGTILFAQPPKPAEGTRWMLNRQFSDEFNGTELDPEKWYDYHPNWKGRQPAIFLPSQVSVADGYLRLKNRKLDSDTVVTYWNGTTGTYNIAGGAVVSRTQGAHYGYYECSQKASKIRMSSTFWMTSGGYPGPDPCPGDKFSQELDIQEAVGGATTAGNASFRNHMHSNSHYNYTNCDGIKDGYSAGAKIKLESGEVSDTFHVYAAHWKSANSADLYLDGKYGATIIFRTDFDPKPFAKPMQINMVTETYDWVQPPGDEDLADDARNTTYIDWVRSWKLVDVDYRENLLPDLVTNGGFENGDFFGWTGWQGYPREVVSDNVYSGNYACHIKGPGAPEQVVNLRSYVTYTLSCYGKVAPGSGPILFGIKNESGEVLGSVQVTETSYTKKSFKFTTGSTGAGLKFYFYAPNADTEGWGDDFELVLEDPVVEQPEEVPVFNENLRFEERPTVLPTNLPIGIPVLYQANGDREIHLQLRDADSTLLGKQTYPGLAGYGVRRLIFSPDSMPEAGTGYMLIADIRHADSASASPEQTDMLYLTLQDPVEVSVRVLDLRDSKPVQDAMITIREEMKPSSEDGLSTFENVAAGSYDILVQKEGYEDLALTGIEASGDTLIELFLVPVSHLVDVRVVDGYTNEPLAQATISMGEMEQVTDYAGQARLSAYAGTHSIITSAVRYHASGGTVSIDSDTTLLIALLRSLADVKFVVKVNGSGLNEARVTVAGMEDLTSSIGIVNFTDLKTDTTYTYSVEHEETGMLEDSFLLRTDSTLRLNLFYTGENEPDRNSQLKIYPNPSGGTITVTGAGAKTHFCIRNLLGATVMEGILSEEQTMDLSGLKCGIYFVSIGDHPPLKLVKE